MSGAPVPSAEHPFKEPWEAQVFALTLALHQRGSFTWEEWTQRLGARIAAEPDHDGSAYYEYWLDALRALLHDQGLVGTDVLAEHTAAWDRAARATPHGRPIEPPPIGAARSSTP